MCARLFEFDAFLGNDGRMAYLSLRPDKNGKPQKAFTFTADELTKTIERVEFAWGAQASIQMRRKQLPIPVPFIGMC